MELPDKLLSGTRCIALILMCHCTKSQALPNDAPFPPHVNTDYHIFGDYIDYPGVISWCANYVNEAERWTRFQGCEPSPASFANVGCTAYIRTSTTIAPVCKLEFRCRFQEGPHKGEYALDQAPFKSNPYCAGSVSEAKNRGACTGCPGPKAGNPINIGTGNKFQLETDYQASNPNSGLGFHRYYNSQSDRVLRLGPGWSADFLQRIRPYPGLGIAYAIRPDAREYYFYQSGNQWLGDPDVPARLEALTDANGITTGWLLTLPDDSVEEYRVNQYGNGVPVSITQRNGLTTRLFYDVETAEGGDDNPNTLDRVVGPFGRILQFSYNEIPAISMVTDPAGNEIRYQYDANKRLVNVIYPDDTPPDINDNPVKIYHYENTDFPNALTGITDENGNRYASWEYDSEGRAISSEHAGGVERVDITYNTNGKATVVDSKGMTLIYEFVRQHGVVKVSHINGGPCSSCSTTQSVTYDDNGYVASRTDYRGNTTVYVHNDRGLETSRTEAIGTDQERTVTTEWHPVFRLPVSVTVSGRVTTFIYDNRGLLLERLEQATE